MTRSEKKFYDKILPKAQAIGQVAAYSQFTSMLNPKYRGNSFKWEEFVKFAVQWAKTTCWQPFSDTEWKRWEKEIVSAAAKSAEYTAKRILEESGLLEWWPDPTKKLSSQVAVGAEVIEGEDRDLSEVQT